MSMLRVLPLILLATPVAASAQSMNAGEFHRRANALKAKGPLAVFSGDIKVLMNEVKASAERSRVQRLATVKSGGTPRYCPPPGKQQLGSTEFMNRLEAIPAGDRSRIDMTEATTRILSAKWPCG